MIKASIREFRLASLTVIGHVVRLSIELRALWSIELLAGAKNQSATWELRHRLKSGTTARISKNDDGPIASIACERLAEWRPVEVDL